MLLKYQKQVWKTRVLSSIEHRASRVHLWRQSQRLLSCCHGGTTKRMDMLDIRVVWVVPDEAACIQWIQGTHGRSSGHSRF